jgi:hypothetical protein
MHTDSAARYSADSGVSRVAGSALSGIRITWFGTTAGDRLGGQGGMAGRTVVRFVTDPRPDASSRVRCASVRRTTRRMHFSVVQES